MTARGQRAAGWLTFALALALRLGYVATLDDALTWPDEGEYVAIGRRLAGGEGFVASSYRSAPVLPAYLGLVFSAFGGGFLAPRVGQAVLGALSCVLVGRAAGLLASPAVGVLSGALLAVYPAHVYLVGVFYPSCLETVLSAWCVLLAALVLRGRGAGTAFLCGVALGATVLTRPVCLSLAPAIAVAWWVARAAPRRRVLAMLAALTLGAAVTVLPWTARNRAVFGRAILVSSGGGLTFWKGNNELADGGADDRFLGIDRPIWRARLARLDPERRHALEEKYAIVQERIRTREREVGDYYLAMDDVLRPVARAYVAAEPGAALRRALRKLATFFSAFTPTATPGLPGAAALLAAATFYPLLGLAALGVALGAARRGLVLPYLVLASSAAVHAALTSCTRFRLPVDPYVIVGASFTVLALLSRGARTARAPRPGAAVHETSVTKV